VGSEGRETCGLCLFYVCVYQNCECVTKDGHPLGTKMSVSFEQECELCTDKDVSCLWINKCVYLLTTFYITSQYILQCKSVSPHYNYLLNYM
jgi:hypothetical protein